MSLIIIGLVVLSYPLYVHMCPAGLSDADRIAVFTKQNEATYAAVSTTSEGFGAAEEEVVKDKEVEMTPAASPAAENQV